MEKFLVSLENASRTLQMADHITYMTYPLLKEKRLLIRILQQIYVVVSSIVNVILQYEYYYKRIQLYTSGKENFETFKKCAKRYGITEEEIKNILKIFVLIEKHKESPLEFVRREKFVILSDNLRTETITIDNLKEYLATTKNLLKKASMFIKK